ncbi:cytochrome P450 [Hypoxylon sp. FL1284]|nr:cytochrome P450 [Hypoxylon sp. FL1284]
MLELPEALTRPAVLGPVLLLVAYAAYSLVLRPSTLPAGVPIVGARPGEWFGLWRARWRNARDMEGATATAYREHRDRVVVLPVAGACDFVQVPARELQWLVDQPDADVDLHTQVLDTLQIDYTVVDPRLVHDPVHHKLISTLLTRETGNLVPDLLDETRIGVDALFGGAGDDGEGFREVCVYDALRRVIGQVTNRVFVGQPLCRDGALLDAGIAYAQDVPMGSAMLRLVPAPLRPLLAPLLTLPNRLHTRRFYRILRPEVERRLAAFRARRDPAKMNGKEEKEEEPNDFLQWCIAQAAALGDPYYARPETLSGRVLLLNFASIHTSSFALTHALLDLAAADPACVAELRAEVQGVLAARGGAWDKRALGEMRRLDSVMRESQRLHSFVTLAVSRKVVRPGGVVTPSGVRVPRGAVLCAPSYPVFHDPDIYPDPDRFVPFRFADIRSGGGEGGERKGDAGSSSYVQRARQAFATTSPDYVAFGHGRHACPGRFFAATELKLILAYIVTHYDIEPLARRPDNLWIGMNRIPPMKATIRVRRRKEATV